MADEPAIPASRVSDAHDAMEGQLDPSCFSLSESGVCMRDGTTESSTLDVLLVSSPTAVSSWLTPNTSLCEFNY